MEKLTESNYIKVFKTIAYSTCPVNVATMASEQSMSPPTISRIINDMKSKGIVKLAGHEKIECGRNRNLYSLNPDYTCVVSVSVNKNNVKVFLADFCGNVLDFELLHIQQQSCEVLIQQIFELVRTVIGRRYPETDYKQFISCIGISVAGFLKYEEDCVYATIDYLDGWENIEIKQRFAKEFGLKVFVEKDVVVGLLGTKRRFPAQKNILFILIEIGIGCAMLINDSLYRGGNNFAGEIGSMLEGYYEIRRIQREAYELYRSNKDLKLVSLIRENSLEIHGPEDFNLRILDRMALEGDYQVIELLLEPIRVWAKMIVNICCCIDPELIVIDGQVTEETPYIIERLKANVERRIKREVNIQTIGERDYMDNVVNYFTVSSAYDYMAQKLDR